MLQRFLELFIILEDENSCRNCSNALAFRAPQDPNSESQACMHICVPSAETGKRRSSVGNFINTLTHETVHLIKGLDYRYDKLEKTAMRNLKKAEEKYKKDIDMRLKKYNAYKDDVEYWFLMRKAIGIFFHNLVDEGTAYLIADKVKWSAPTLRKINKRSYRKAEALEAGFYYVCTKYPDLKAIDYLLDEYLVKLQTHMEAISKAMAYVIYVGNGGRVTYEDLMKMTSFKFIHAYERACARFNLPMAVTHKNSEGALVYNNCLRYLRDFAKRYEVKK